MLEYLAFRIGSLVANLLPERVGYFVFEWVGRLAYWIAIRSRRAVNNNLQHVLCATNSNARLSESAHRVFQTQALNYYDLLKLSKTSLTKIHEQVEVHGWCFIESALAMQRGAIILTAHYGNLDIASQIFRYQGLNLTVVVERLKSERLFRFLVNQRSTFGISLVPSDAPMGKVYRVLKEGGLVALAMDRDVTGSGQLISFFGLPAHLPDGYARIARRTGVPIIPGFGMRLNNHKLRATFGPVIDVSRTTDPNADILEIIDRSVRVAEKQIAADPGQWVMFQPVWNTASS